MIGGLITIKKGYNMKNTLLLAVLLVFFIGCDKDRGSSDCDAIYTTEFRVENRSDREIVISSETQNASNDETISPGRVLLVDSRYKMGPCDGDTLMEDIFTDDYRICVGGTIDYPFTMTIDGEEVSSDIWLRKYWSFRPEQRLCTYTLFVTDRLLSELADKDE